MQSVRSQAGMSVPGMIVVLAMLGFFAISAIRMTPPYFEYLSVKSIIEGIVLDPATEDLSARLIRQQIETNFNTNQIYGTTAREVDIYRKKGKTYIDASYEKRQPVVWRIDSVLKFNDLHYVVGEGEPIRAEDDPRKSTGDR